MLLHWLYRLDEMNNVTNVYLPGEDGDEDHCKHRNDHHTEILIIDQLINQIRPGEVNKGSTSLKSEYLYFYVSMRMNVERSPVQSLTRVT